MSNDGGASSTFNGDFARLVPRNQLSERLFSATYLYTEGNKTFHLRFFEPPGSSGSRSNLTLDEPVESSTDYDTHVDTDNEDARLGYPGHFVLSFNKEREPEFPHLGWRVGRGNAKSPANRGVDLLLARPGDNLSKCLAGVHMIFRFNLESGLLMVKAGSPKVPVEYRQGINWEQLGFESEKVIYETPVKLRIGRCEYELEHIVEDRFREDYFRHRGDFFKTLLPVQGTNRLLRKIPGDNFIRRGRYLEIETRGSGAFGWITQGVDTLTGDLVAIKELRINSKTVGEAREEVAFGKCFQNKPGLLPTLSAICEHGHNEICCELERLFIFMPSAISDFSSGFWKDPGFSKVTKLQWLRGPLEGIRELHAMGIMHRDIRRQNTLLMSIEPPRASLCDYGKAVKAEHSTVSTIGPVYTLAPEIWTVKTSGPYTAKVDIWSYGYTIAEVLGYVNPDNSKITPTRHTLILKMLAKSCEKNPEDALLEDLVTKLLAWKVEDRWSAEQALGHECWLPLLQQPQESLNADQSVSFEEEAAKRVRRIDVRPKESEACVEIPIATQEFSAETRTWLHQPAG